MRPMALREAVAVGIADVEAGRYVQFDTSDALREYLSGLVEEAIGGAASTQDGT